MSDRNQAIERLLRARVNRSREVEGAECLSADTIAAWADRTLTARSREAVEAHASDCTRCQALLAAMVLTETEPEPARSFWGGPVRWLAPLAAGITAVALWVAVPEQQAGRDLDQRPQLSESEAQPARAVADEPAALEDASPPAAAVPQESPMAGADESVSAGAPSEALGGARERDATEQLANEFGSPGRGGVVGGEVQGQARLEETGAASEVARRSQAQMAKEPAPPAAEEVQNGALALRSSADVMVEQRAFADRLDRRLEVSTADDAVRWRLGPDGDVERSRDGGLTWSARPTGVGPDLLAGAAPTAGVCWLVGRRGTVVLTIDAETWRRLPFPEPADLTLVEASDGLRASVTTDDGRTFETTDGGATWTEVARP